MQKGGDDKRKSNLELAIASCPSASQCSHRQQRLGPGSCMGVGREGARRCGADKQQSITDGAQGVA